MKLSQVVDPRFKSAFNRLSAQSLPLRLAFKLRGIAANIAKQSEEFEAVRLAALNKFGMHDAEGKLKVNERNEVELSPGGSAGVRGGASGPRRDRGRDRQDLAGRV
jgi:hypothetical protein